MVHTPRLCLDGRTASDFPLQGMVAQEVIDQLVAAKGEPGASSEWLEKQRVVLLTHADQVFSGQLKRHDTKARVGKMPWHWWWEKQFVRRAPITAFHRFRPADCIGPAHDCPTFTTLLPPKTSMPFFLSRRKGGAYFVPSQKDSEEIGRHYGIPAEQVTVLTPGVRRYVFYSEAPKVLSEGSVLILSGSESGYTDFSRLTKVISTAFPRLPKKFINLRKKAPSTAEQWTNALQNVRVVFYLAAPSFDWATLPLESLFWKIPTVFLDQNRTLSELLPQSGLKLSRFLIDQPDLATLDKETEKARPALFLKGVYDSLGLAKQYAEAFRRIEIPAEFRVSDEAAPPAQTPPCQCD